MKHQDSSDALVLQQMQNLITGCKECEKEIESVKRNRLYLYEDALDLFNDRLAENLGYAWLPTWGRQCWKQHRKAHSPHLIAELLIELKHRNWSLFDLVNVLIAYPTTPPLRLIRELLWN